MQGRQNDALLILAECYQSFESGKKRKVRGAFCRHSLSCVFWLGCYQSFESNKKRKERDECKGVRMTLYLFWRSAISRLKAGKNAKCEVHFAGTACLVFFGWGAISRLKAIKNAKNEMNARASE